MAYLIPKDYNVNIQDVNLQQIISADETIRTRAQMSGEAEAVSYLRQKYDISREFQDLLPFVFNKTYAVFNRFYLDAVAYLAANTYNENDLTLNGGSVYICISGVPVTGTFNPADWLLLGKQYDLFYCQPPHPEFTYANVYNIGDDVYWNGKTYTCRVQTALLSHDTAIQYRTIQNVPLNNVAPDDPQNGVQYWGAGVAYSVTGVLPTDETYYTKADSRDQQMVLYLIDIVLYHLHTRIAPRNIPELRVKRYDDAIEWLRMCAEGKVTPNLPLIQPMQGNRIRFGGNIRNINSY